MNLIVGTKSSFRKNSTNIRSRFLANISINIPVLPTFSDGTKKMCRKTTGIQNMELARICCQFGVRLRIFLVWLPILRLHSSSQIHNKIVIVDIAAGA